MKLTTIVLSFFLVFICLSIQAQENIKWIDAKTIKVEGKGWQETEGNFDRFPLKAKEILPNGLFDAGQQTPGIAIRFKTNSSTLKLKWTLKKPPFVMAHMTAVGSSGFDLYVKTPQNEWTYMRTAIPKDSLENEVELFAGKRKSERTYLLNFPLYNRAIEVSLGIDEDSNFEVVESGSKKSIVAYGTSIVQGCSASRPGMVYTAILGRRFDCEVLNLGFSGSAHMEPVVCDLLAELNPSAYIIDALPNMTNDPVYDRTINLVETIRKSRQNTPIILVECIYRAAGRANGTRSEDVINSKFKAAYNQLEKQGVKNLYYVEGENLIGNDSEGTIDGTHTTDLGFFRMADVIGKALEKAFQKDKYEFL